MSLPTDFEDDVIIKTIEMHTCGEPLRIVESGYPELQGVTLLDKRRYLKEHLDHYRKLLMFEPRGHYDMYGALLVTPDIEGADIAAIFMHNEGYSTMCGHAVIALGRYAIDYGFVQNPTSPETKVGIQCPCGLVEAFVEYQPGETTEQKGRTGAVRFNSVPAFVFQSDLTINIEGYGNVTVDVSYGGAFYAFVKDKDLNMKLKSSPIREIVDAAYAIKKKVSSELCLSHPDNDDLAFLFGTIITDGDEKYDDTPPVNVCLYADRQVCRSPCGSGVTALVALQYHKGHIRFDKARKFVSGITGEFFTGRVIQELEYGTFKAVVVEVSGKAYYTGKITFTLERDDKLGHGFSVK